MSRFDGSWSVHEHVFSPAGEYLGRVVQTRRLEPLPSDEGRVRVIQDCEPDPSLAGGPMAAFRGHHEFDLVVQGNLRRYQGPAVIGSGLAVGQTAMLGRGVWPAFGYSFSSYAAMVNPRCQLTGGTFSVANRPVAVIVGHAIPADDDGASRDDVSQPVWPGDLGRRWRGLRHRFDATGTLRDTVAVGREYAAASFVDREYAAAGSDDRDEGRLNLEPWAGGYRLSRGEGRAREVGTAMQYGCAMFFDLTGQSEEGQGQEWLELLEPSGRTLISIRRVYRAQQLDRIELCELTVEQEPA